MVIPASFSARINPEKRIAAGSDVFSPFITAILVYFDEIKGNVIDRDGNNTVDIDEQYQANYAKLHGEDTSTMTAMQIRQYNTGTNVVLAGSVKPVNAMEDLNIVFIM